MANTEQPLAVKVGTLALTLAAGWAAQKLVGVIWQKSTGKVAPLDLDDEEIGVIQAVTFAAVTGGVAVFARRFARRGAARAFARFTH